MKKPVKKLVMIIVRPSKKSGKKGYIEIIDDLKSIYLKEKNMNEKYLL